MLDFLFGALGSALSAAFQRGNWRERSKRSRNDEGFGKGRKGGGHWALICLEDRQLGGIMRTAKSAPKDRAER